MSPNYLFLDTEWSDGEGHQLVSLALVSADGEHRFYAERDPLPLNPTSFVAEHVYPLLDRGAVALNDIDFAQSLRRFLSRFDPPHVLFDCANDGALLLHALSGFADERAPKGMGDDSSVVLTLMHTGFTFVLCSKNGFHPTRLAPTGAITPPWMPKVCVRLGGTSRGNVTHLECRLAMGFC